MGLRRLLARRLRGRLGQSWPINAIAGKKPADFPGWPDGRQFAFVLTHDVEGQKGLDRVRSLAEMEMRLGFRSSFNFVPEGQYATPPSLREWLTTNGFEVGVHDLRHDGRLYSSRKKFSSEARKINKYLDAWQAVGFRSGFMLRELHWLRDLNILYDASTFDTDPFEPQSEGVNTTFPFWVPREDHSGYVELPYTMPQDSTLFLVCQETSIDLWKRKLDWIAQQGGMALVNVHPDYVDFGDARDPSQYKARRYEELLEYVTERYREQCWHALPRDVARYVARLYPSGRGANAAVGGAAAAPGDSAEGSQRPSASNHWRLRAKRAAMVTYSTYPGDPRPRRAVDALIREGTNVDLVCLAGEEGNPTRAIVDGVDILRVPITHRRGGALAYAYSYSAFVLISSLILALRTLTRGYDLVYVHNMPDILVLSSLIPKLFGAKVVLDLHDPMPELMVAISERPPDSLWVRILKWLEKWSIGRADAVITVNLACKKIFSSRSCRPEKISVVMNSPDGEIFRFEPPPDPPHPNATKPFVIMYHGSLVERNGVDLAVEALARVRAVVPTAQLRIYGARTAFLDRVLESVRKGGLQGAVHHLGFHRLEDIVEAIRECDVGVIPNQRSVFTEINTPTRIFEYLALGKPVIAPRAPGIQDYFSEDSLLFFELGNAEELARKIQYVFTHPTEATEIVKRGQQVYLAHTWPRQRQILLDTVSGLFRGIE